MKEASWLRKLRWLLRRPHREADLRDELAFHLEMRIRELIEVADHLATGATPGSLVRTLGMKPFRVDKLVGQARRWRVDELLLAAS